MHSARDGRLVRTLWSERRHSEEELVWDMGGDLSGDGVPDLILGFPEPASSGPTGGLVRVISGVDGSELLTIPGTEPRDCHGRALAFLSDVDGDGLADFAVGGNQVRGRDWPTDGPRVCGRSTRRGRAYALFEDGSSALFDQYIQEQLSRRGHRPGYAVLHSGATGRELWRVPGEVPGHGFGTHLVACGDYDSDGAVDLIARCERRSSQPARVLSGADGSVLVEIPHRLGPVGPAGDMDGDGMLDFFVDTGDWDSTARLGGTFVFSGATLKQIAILPYPEGIGEFGVTAGVGDLDGDGFDDLAVGDPSFALRGPGTPGFRGRPVDLRRLSLARAVRLESEPWFSGWESGCVHIWSGRTHQVIAGVWGIPGSSEGVGFRVTSVPDSTGDGWPELLVTDDSRAMVFVSGGGSE